MASTPKAVRRNGGNCTCPDLTLRIEERDFYDSTCKKGHCYSARCRRCRGELFGIGPVACPCEHPRQARYPGMEQPGHWDWGKDEFVPSHVAVKPSIARRRRQ